MIQPEQAMQSPSQSSGSNPEPEPGKEVEDVATKCLEADRIFVLMQKDYRLSRNARAKWYLSHLHGELTVKKYESCADFSAELDAVGIVPRAPPSEWDWDVGHLYRYLVTPRTAVRFLAQRYRFVFLLDLSPSTAASELLNKGVTSSSLLPALRKSLAGLVRPFYVPGSQLLLRPDIYVTVIAWTPFLSESCQAVLHQGWLLTPENLNSFMRDVVTGLHELEQRSSHVTSEVHGEMQALRAESERIFRGLFDETPGTTPEPGIITATADAGFVSMIRTGMMAIQLLPPNSAAGLVVVSDGVMAVPDIHALDTLLNQFRTKMISLSFLQVSSIYHPQSSLTRVPYEELMEFASLSTYGAYLPEVPEVDTADYVYDMNIYHDAFLCWSFRKALQAIHLPNALSYYELFQASDLSLHAGWYTRGRFSGIKNGYFLHTNEERITKKKIKTVVNSSLSSLLSCRLREGYTINEVTFYQENTRIEVKLTLPWKISSFIHYVIDSEWPLKSKQSPCKIQVLLEGDYDTLHDIICQREKHFASKDRNSVIRKFYVMLQHLSYVDKLLVHLESFGSHKSHYTLPDSVANGVPLFHIPMNSTSSKPEITHEDFAHLHPMFTSFWKPISSLDVNIWQRWLHTHKIHLLLNNDSPLPKNFLTPNSSGRYTAVQCRKAALQLSESLKRWSSFVLLDTSTFITFIKPDGGTDGPPSSFVIIRMTSKPPCVVIWIAFPGGTPGAMRHRMLHDLKLKIEQLRIKQHQTFLRHADASGEWIEMPACVLFEKPIERILIRYEQMPHDIFHLLEPAYRSISRQQNMSWTGNFASEHRNGGNGPGREDAGALTFLSLSRYLHHRRWIWSVQASPQIPLSNVAVTRILNTLARQRFHQGFHFAHSHQGIQTMARELTMKTGTGGISVESTQQSCLVQFVVFPPYTSTTVASDMSCSSQSSSEEEPDEATAAEDSELKVITEVWVEPQDGIIVESVDSWPQIGGHRFGDISRQIFDNDFDIISTLSTFEHLSLICQTANNTSPSTALPVQLPQDTSRKRMSSPTSSNVRQISFQWNFGSLLQKSQQTEIFMATFIQSLAGNFWEESDGPNELLYDQLKDQISKLHDREVVLSPKDNESIFEHLRSTPEGDGSKLRFPDPPPQPAPATSRVSSRFTSGTSMNSSSGTTGGETDLRSMSSSVKSTSVSTPGSSLKWVCYIKGLSGSHFLLTILPRSFRDLKYLLIDDAAIDGKNPLGLHLVQTPIPKVRQYPLWTPDESLASSMISLGPEDAMRKRSLSGSNDLRERISAAARAKRAALKTRTDSNEVPNTMRTRTMSIDSSALAAAERSRCRSMDSNNQPTRGGITPNTHKLLLTRVRTQTHSHVNKATKTPVESGAKDQLKVTPTPRPSKKVWGSLTLPVFVFDCNVSNIILQLLAKGQAEELPRTGITLDTRPESRANDGKKSEWNDPPSPATKDPLSRMEKTLRLHCINLQMSYFKSFVMVLFRSLQHRLPTHTFDVQSAIDYCDNEAVLETDLSEFLLKVCGHVKQVTTAHVQPHEQDHCREDSPDENQPSGDAMVSFATLQEAKPCCQIFTNHNVIKKKFCDILQTSFRPVPQVDDLYFYCPSGSALGDDFFPVPSRQRRDTDDQISELDFSSDRLKMFSRETQDHDESLQYMNSQEAGSLSILSSAAASDDQSDLNESEGGETSPPLFLQFSVTIRQNREVVDSIYMSELPSCLVDLVQRRVASATNLVEKEHFQSLELSKLNVTLDLLTMTLPRDMTLPLKCDPTRRSVSFNSSLSLPEADTSYLLEGVVRDEIDSSDERLPRIQLEAVNSLIAALKWMLEDEIAFAMTQATPITQSVLSKVAGHIEASKDKPGCVLQQVPLHFVFGAERSLTIFLQMFDKLSLPGYQLRQEGKYFYLIQGCKSVDPVEDVVVSDPHPHGHFQLSPVKELTREEEEEHAQAMLTDVYAWQSDPGIEARKSPCPTFWLIMRVWNDKVSVYFQYREGQFDSVLPWRQAQQQVTAEIKALCKKVNQKLLLEDLYESRQCNRLLETETTEEAWPTSEDILLTRQSSQFDAGDIYEVTFLEANLNVRFKPGSFSCSPPVWQTQFPLHPRVKQSQAGHNRGSIALHSLKNVLNPFAVSNRSNMFVYRDEKGNIFYIKIFEVIMNPLSRKPSALSGKMNDPDETGSGYVMSRSSSICSWNGTDILDSGNDDRVELKVYGISPAGSQITNDLVELLERKLNEKVVEVLSVMLQRNPMCKLSPEDVRFLQRPNSAPTTVFRFSICPKFRGSKTTKSILFYFMQNIVHQFATLPKYSSPLLTYQFQDISDDGQMNASSNVFLYNRVPSIMPKYGKNVGGHRAIACIALSVKQHPDYEGLPGEDTPFSEDLLNSCDFSQLVKVKLLTEGTLTDSSSPLVMQFNIWEQGRIDTSVLREQLELVASQSLWDVVTELHLLPQNLPSPTANCLSTLYSHFLTNWLIFGLSLSVATVQKQTISFCTKYAPVQTVKELQNKVTLAIQDTKTEVFQKRVSGGNSISYVPCSSYQVSGSDPKLVDEYILIGRNLSHWQSCKNYENANPEDLMPPLLRSMQKFQPFLHISPEMSKGRANSVGSKSIDSDLASFGSLLTQEFSFIPRQRILVAHITRKGIELLTYNYSKDSIERLGKHLTALGHWFSARSSLGSSVVAQKLGLFHNSKFCRSHVFGDNPYMGHASHVETLVKNYSPPIHLSKVVASSGLSSPRTSRKKPQPEDLFMCVYRDVKPVKPLQKCAYSIERDVTGRQGRQMLELLAVNEKDKLRKLHTVWQTRGENCVIFAEEMVSHFEKIARLVHFCMTPLLFLPKWRQEAHSTRLRSECGDPLSTKTHCSETPKPDSPKPLRRTAIDERHHSVLVQNYLQDYIQYLQTLGFLVMQTRRDSPRRSNPTGSSTSGSGSAFFRKENTRNSQSGKTEDLYLQKSLPAGILIFHVGICEPFVFTKLYTLEYSRIQSGSISGRMVHHSSTLVEECDRIKFLLHTHSFTYDFHLRAIHSLVAGRPILRKGFNMVAFIEDFIKYYNKGPNFARDLLTTGMISLPTGSSVSPTQLYNYVLSHEKSYDFRVLRMEPLFVEADGVQFNCDFVLARQTHHKLSYSFNSEKRNSDDFDMTLIIGHVEEESSPLLRLKYFIILTSKREIYPTIGNDKNQGQFKTVLFNLSSGMPTATPPRSRTSQDEREFGSAEIAVEVKETDDENQKDLEEFLKSGVIANLPDLFRPAVGEPNIRPESVHYVGYFSNHEQSMQTVMQLQMSSTENALRSVFTRATSHCRRDHLWNRLHTNSPVLSFAEFSELLALIQVQTMHVNDLSARGSAWFQKLVRLLSLKYESQYRKFISTDCEHHILLRENNVDVCTLITIDLRGKAPTVFIVFREQIPTADPPELKGGAILSQQMSEAFVADSCYYIWSENF